MTKINFSLKFDPAASPEEVADAIGSYLPDGFGIYTVNLWVKAKEPPPETEG